MAEAASIAGFEPTYFSRYFRRIVGLSFVTWNGRIRVEKAKLLLEDLRMPVSAVAAAVGYNDVTTFERNFRKCAFISPSKYRKRLMSGERKQSTRNAENSTRNAETPTQVLLQTQRGLKS
jgi:AraC-like DNA-binding protein